VPSVSPLAKAIIAEVRYSESIIAKVRVRVSVIGLAIADLGYRGLQSNASVRQGHNKLPFSP